MDETVWVYAGIRGNKIIMQKRKFILVFILAVIPSCLFSQGLTYEEQMYDFGHIGMDYKIQHTYIFENRTDVPIKIKDIYVSCDCTGVRSADTLVMPGDTAFFNLTFNTKDFYGPVNKSFTVETDHPKLPKLEYFYVSIVGQWFNGLKPNPISLFFLPSKKIGTISIPNVSFDEITIESVKHFRNYVSTQIKTKKAEKGKFVEVEVIPDKNLKSGTYQTTVTIKILTDDNDNIILSIPVKIVRY